MPCITVGMPCGPSPQDNLDTTEPSTAGESVVKEKSPLLQHGSPGSLFSVLLIQSGPCGCFPMEWSGVEWECGSFCFSKIAV